MKKNVLTLMFGFGVILISLFLLTAFRPEVKSVAPAAKISADHVPDAVDAADLSAARWQAMAEFYEEQGMLTRDNFDYEQAAENSAARWQAMAEFYEEQGMLTRDNFDYEQAADLSATRWQAMAEFYEEQGLLTRDNFDYER
jgi:putative heme degradation protein